MPPYTFPSNTDGGRETTTRMSTMPRWSGERDVNRSVVDSLTVSKVTASGEDVPAPRDSLLFHFLQPLLPLRRSQFVFHPNLESKLIVTQTYFTHPLTPLKRYETPSEPRRDCPPDRHA